MAGTNGKGSTTLMIAKVLNTCGYRAGRYSSPHLHSYCERFEIDDRAVTPGQLLACLDTVLAAAHKLPAEDFPTEFEVLTAAAFLLFKDQQVDIAVMETGMGGIYDATTAADPLLSVITSIDYDHTAYLGNTLGEIAANKAGIIKPGIPVVIGPMEPEARQVITECALKLNSPILDCSATRMTPSGSGDLFGQYVDIQVGRHRMEKVWFSLAGNFQLDNLSCALTALNELEKMSFVIEDEYIKPALGKLHSKGRLEVLSEKPLIICDVGHNPQAAQALHNTLHTLLLDRSKVLLVGMVDDKDAVGVLKFLGPGSTNCVVTRPLGQRGSNWQRLAGIWSELFPHIPVSVVEDIEKAADLSLTRLRSDDYLLVTGSFYLIDKARQYMLKTFR